MFSILRILFQNQIHSCHKKVGHGPPENSIILHSIDPQTLIKEFRVSMSNGWPSMSVLLANPQKRLRNVDLIG